MIESIFDVVFGHHHLDTFQVLLILMVTVWGAGRITKWIGLPPVLGEILAGVLIGPSVLGVLENSEVITVLAELGVFFLMFHSGLDTHLNGFLKRAKSGSAMALGGIGFIFLLTAIWLGWFSPTNYSFLTITFVGCVFALNSLPVISSVLKSYKIRQHKIGLMTIASSVFDEIFIFIAISIVIVAAQSGSLDLITFSWILFKVGAFFGVSFILGRLLLPIVSPRILNKSGSKGFTFALIVALFYGVLAERIGLHSVVGAYVAGVFVRAEIQNNEVLKKIEDRFYGLSHSFLGPIFFASVGMMIPLSLLLESWIPVLIGTVLVFVGQVFGSGVVMKQFGFTWRESIISSSVLVGRGSTEIVLAGIGFSTIVATTGEPLIDQNLFGILIGVSFFTTLIMPILVKYLIKFNHIPKKA